MRTTSRKIRKLWRLFFDGSPMNYGRNISSSIIRKPIFPSTVTLIWKSVWTIRRAWKFGRGKVILSNKKVSSFGLLVSDQGFLPETLNLKLETSIWRMFPWRLTCELSAIRQNLMSFNSFFFRLWLLLHSFPGSQFYPLFRRFLFLRCRPSQPGFLSVSGQR